MRMKSNLAKFGVVAGVAMMGLMASTPAFATSANSTETLTVTAGSLSVSPTTAATIKAAVDASGTGALPSAVWADTTGSGNGWQGSVAATDLTYTGTWVAGTGSTALTTATSSPFTGLSDGVTYTVTVTSSTAFTYTSTDANDASGSGTYTAGTAANVGTKGLSITLPSGITSGTYTIQAGTQNASAIALDNSSSNTAATIAPVTGTTSANPTFVSANSSATVTGGGTGAATYGTAVTFLSAALNTGMGQYTVSPGATVTADMNSFAANYVGNIQYTIATGPAA